MVSSMFFLLRLNDNYLFGGLNVVFFTKLIKDTGLLHDLLNQFNKIKKSHLIKNMFLIYFESIIFKPIFYKFLEF